jgi:cyclophilin family peptidyl-prolyl cis-trans isomerase
MTKFAAFLVPLFALALLIGCTPTDATVLEGYSASEGMTASSDTLASAPASASTMTASAPSDGKIKLLSGKHTVVLKTSKGDITLELDADLAAMTVTNFVTLAKDNYYKDILFHRVISDFMIQGGDPDGNGTGGRSIYGDEFPDEIDPSNAVYAGGYKRGTVAMANRGPNTNGSQFFIMHADYPLPPSYTIFGKVTKGMDVVDAIATVERDGRDKPVSPVTFTAVAE